MRYVGGETDGVTSVEVVTNGTLSGTVVLPDERNPEAFDAIGRETFLLRGRTLADFINKTKTEKWKALVEILGLDAIESLREDLQRARNELRKGSKAAEEQVRIYERTLTSGSEKVTRDSILSNLQQICGLLNVDPPRSLDQVDNPEWLTAAIGASAGVSETSDRESVLAEIKALSPPAFDRRAVEAWNQLVSSERAQLLPRAALVREAKRLFETGSFDKGRCPLCGQAVDDKSLARRIEAALVEVMEASRDLEHVRDPVAQQADDLEAAHDKRRSIQNRARAMALDLSPLPDIPYDGLRDCIAARAPVEIDTITNSLSELRKWDRATAAVARKASNPEPSSRDTQLVMLAGLCQQVNAWRVAEKKVTRARRAMELVERVFNPARRRHQQLRRRAPRAAGGAPGRRVLRVAAHRADARSAVLRTPVPPGPVLA